MADDIDIEEHDVMDHPVIKQVFPDLAIVKHEIMDFVEDPTESTEESKDCQLQPDAIQPDSTTEDLDTLLAEPIKIEDSDSYTPDEEKPSVAAAPEFLGAFDDREISVDELRPSPFLGNKIIVGGNKIILGRKPANRTVSDGSSAIVRDTKDKCAEIKENCDLEKDEIKRCLSATLVLKDWDYYLQNCGGFCEDCGILFPTVNSFDAHKMLAHSFLVAVQERSITPAPETGSAKNVDAKNTQCQICSKVFSSRGNLLRHYMNIHHCRAPPMTTTDLAPKRIVPTKQVARKHTAPIVPKSTLNIAANNNPVAEPSGSENEDCEYKPQCLICEKFFSCNSSRNFHYRKIHLCEPPMIDSAPMQAAVAPRQVARKHALKVPKLTIKIASNAKNTYTIKKPPVIAKPAPAPNVTKLTPSKTATKSSMNPKVPAQGASKVKKHANPTPKSDMVCGHCNIEFPSKEDLINHLYDLLTPTTAANPPSYDCDQCNVKIKHKSELARHKLSKSHLLKTNVLKQKEKPSTEAPRQYFRCQICFFYIVNECDVKKHIEKYHSHVKNVKYMRSGFVPVCKLCNSTLVSYKFYNRHILNVHKRDNFKKTASADRLPKPMKAKPHAAFPTIGTGKPKGTMPTFATIKVKATHQMAGTSKPKTTLPTTGSSKPRSTVPTFGTKPKAAVPMIGTSKPKATAPTFSASKVKSKQFEPVNIMKRIKKIETSRLLYMKNPPIPQTTLFKCPKCRTHFATHLSANFHMSQCKGKMITVFRCNKCNVIMKSHNKALHEKQHLFTDEFEVVTMSRDKKASLKYLSNCPKCGIHFKEYKFWQHYEGCGRITHDSFYCHDCDLLVDETIKRTHKKLHQMGGEFKIFEYAAIDNATNERIESKLAASAVKTDTKTINKEVKADEKVPKVLSHEEKSIAQRKEAGKGHTKVTNSEVKVDKVAPKTKDLKKKKRSPLKRKRGYEYDANYTVHKKRKVVRPKVPRSERYDPKTNSYDDRRVIRDVFKLRYCDTCHRFITLAGSVKYHISKACVDSPRPVICTHCGIALTSGPLRTHLKMHQLHKNLTLQDFEFYELNSNKRIKPPLPRLMFCTNCKTYNKRRKLPGEKLQPHNCNEEKIKCEICDIQLTEFAYGIHMSFHNYDVTGVKASEEMSKDVETHHLALSNRQQTYLRTLYQCGVCKVMLTEKHLEQHKRFNDCHALKKGYVQCGHCKFSILGKDYRVHIRQHRRDPSFCKDNFTIIPFEKEVRAADDTNEGSKGKQFKVFICEKCELCVEPRSEARSHKCNKKMKTYYCPVCELNVQRPTHINRHRLYADFIPENTDYVKFSIDRKRVTFDEIDPSDSDYEDDGKYRLYRCRNCEMCLELPRCAVKHIHQIHKCYPQKKRYVCPICEYQFFHFRVHARKHEQRPDFVRDNITLIEFGKKLGNNDAAEKTNEPTKKATNSILLNLLQHNDVVDNDEIDDFKLYACRKCNIKYYKPSVVKTHACAKNMIPYRCLQCRLTFDDVGYKTHILLHSKYPDYKGSSFDIVPFGIGPKSTTKPLAPIRPNVTRVPVAATSTFDTTVSDGATTIYKCLCGLHFLCRTTLDEHQTVCSPIHRAPGQCCTKCNLLFTPKSLYQHLLQHHGIKAGDFKYNIVEADLGGNVNLKTLYKCADCENHFVNRMILKDHYRANECKTDTSNQECPNCGLEFHYTNLVKHNQLHHGTDDLQEDDFEVLVLDKNDFPGLENEELASRNNITSEKEDDDGEYDGLAIDNNQDDSDEYNSVIDAADKTLFKCRKCEMHFMLESALEAHSSRECELSKQEECSTCGLIFALNSLRRHTQLHHEQLNLNVEDFTFKDVDETKKRRSRKKSQIPSENVLHKCKKCNIYFMSYRTYSMHVRSRNRHFSGKNKLTCEKCDIVMPQKSYYKHNFLHHRLRNLTLDDIAVTEHSNENQLNDLMEYNMLISDDYYTKVLKTRYNQKLHKCDKCNIHFMTTGALAVHVLKYEHKTPKDRSIVSCDHCGLAFLEQSLIRHKYIHHDKMRFELSELEVKTEIAPKKNRRELAKLPQKLYKCGHCEIHFMNPNTCYRHVTATHKKVKGVNCDACKLKFVRRSLEKHIKAHHDKGHDLKDIIIEDYEPVDDEGDLPKIDIYMAEGVPLKTEPIKKEKAEVTERTARVRKRASNRIMTCRANNDNFLFKCKVCDVYFLTGYSLEKHLLNHQGFKDPVRCEKCDIVLSKHSRSRHNQMHHSPNNDLSIDDFVIYEFPDDNKNVLHRCNKCNVYFLTFSAVDSHAASNHRIVHTTVTCEKCHIDMTKDSLKRHMAQHHSPGDDLTLDDIFIVEYYSSVAEMETQDGETTEPDMTKDIRVTRSINFQKRKYTSLEINKPSKRMCMADTETTLKQRNIEINETNDYKKRRVPLRLSQIVTATINNKLIQPQTSAIDEDDVSIETDRNKLDIIAKAPKSLSQIARTAINFEFIQLQTSALDKDIAKTGAIIVDKDIQSTSNDKLKILAKVLPRLSKIATATIRNKMKQRSSVLESENHVIDDEMNKTDEMGVTDETVDANKLLRREPLSLSQIVTTAINDSTVAAI